MAYTYIDSSAGTRAALGISTTPDINSTGATLALVVVTYYSGLSGALGSGAITDSKSNTYTPLTNYTATGSISDSSTRWFYCENPSVGSGHNATVTSGSTIVAGIGLMAFSGGATSSAFDVENGNQPSSSSTTRTAGSVTPSQNNSLCVAAVQAGDSLSGIAVDSGFSLAAGASGVAGFTFGVQMAYLIQGSAGAVNPEFSATSPDFRSAAIAVFKPSGGGGGSNQPMMRRWGGVPALGGQGIGNKGPGRMWGRTKNGLIVPRRLAA